MSAWPHLLHQSRWPRTKHRHRHSLYAAEASGLMVIAVLLLILSLVRYWQYINWSAR